VAKQIQLTDKEIATIVEAFETYPTSQKGTLQPRHKRLIEKLTKPHKRIKISSAKAKGRELQKWAVIQIANLLGYDIPEEKDLRKIRSREMGQAGTDVVIEKEFRQDFPFAVECKNCEQISLPAFIEQAKKNTSTTLPHLMLIVRNKSIKEPVVIMNWAGVEFLFNHSIIKDIGSK